MSGMFDAAKPTILAFHGSGSNGTVHTVQLARLARLLKEHFEIVSMEAPFPSAAGPGILPFFEGCGPFKRWIPPWEKVTIEGMKKGEASPAMPPEVESLIRSQITQIQSTGGRVVGLVGFSQGTRIVAGLLRASEIVREKGYGAQDCEWLAGLRFAVSVCGSYPPPLVPGCAAALVDDLDEVLKKKIEIPTLHVQGNQDEWEWAGKQLIEGSYEVAEGKSEVVGFDMAHHYPVSVQENERIRDWMLAAWERTKVGKRV